MFDQLARASALPLLTVTPAAAVLWALSGDVADLATIRAIRRAAERSAPVHAVPHPSQVRVVVEPPLTRMFGVLFFVLVVACLGVVTMIVMPFTEGHVDDYVPIGLIGSLLWRRRRRRRRGRGRPVGGPSREDDHLRRTDRIRPRPGGSGV